jgi:class 3 adenylate cyclase
MRPRAGSAWPAASPSLRYAPPAGRDLPETARFCAWCGEPRKPEARVAEVPGERKQATILFADVAGSTARIASLDAEAAM